MTFTWEDAEEIRELLANYCYFLDGHQLDKFADLFTPEGTWSSRNGSATGPQAIEALLRALMPMPTENNRRKHLTSNISIRPAGNTARVKSNFLSVRNTAAGPVFASIGTYEDVVVKKKGCWKFNSRQLFHDIMGDVGLTVLAEGSHDK